MLRRAFATPKTASKCLRYSHNSAGRPSTSHDVPEGAIKLTEQQQADHRASAKLFADAEREEEELREEARKSKLPFLERQHDNWTGDERIEDAVLRMLVDKYKPVRGGTVRSADEKLKSAPPKTTSTGPGAIALEVDEITQMETRLADDTGAKITTSGSSTIAGHTPSVTGSWADEPLLPAIEGHRPWHTEYRAPSHSVASVKFARLPPSPPSPKAKPADERIARKEKEVAKRTAHAGRLHGAREATLDYKLGLGAGRQKGAPPTVTPATGARPNPVSVKGWTSLVEDRIERARQKGLFNNVKGRGQPIKQQSEESNPFIGKEEFLMNRILQRNEASPPWVEVQGELESAVRAWRLMLRQAWTRRALRNLNTEHPPQTLRSITAEQVRALRDPAWEARERAYHDVALGEVNALVRKYNGLAPYPVRRPYYMLHVELERVYEGCVDDVMEGLAERYGKGSTLPRGASEGEDGERGGGEGDGSVMGLGELLRSWVQRLTGGWTRS
ncbi:hypothetical protein K525DRAFT_243364 [Schizophyllum commune Loenen D]|nr:hypothetical protein K525DRAFT_243364 [Schizophyllum commune Loenen D]